MVACESLHSGHELGHNIFFMSTLVRKSLLELEFGISTFSHTSFERTQYLLMSDRCTDKHTINQKHVHFQNLSNSFFLFSALIPKVHKWHVTISRLL